MRCLVHKWTEWSSSYISSEAVGVSFGKPVKSDVEMQRRSCTRCKKIGTRRVSDGTIKKSDLTPEVVE